MTSFYRLKTYKAGECVWKSPNLSVHTLWMVPCYKFYTCCTNRTLFHWVNANAFVWLQTAKNVQFSRLFEFLPLIMTRYSDFFRSSYKLSSFLKLFSCFRPIPGKREKANLIFISTLLCSASKGFMKAFKELFEMHGEGNIESACIVFNVQVFYIV